VKKVYEAKCFATTAINILARWHSLSLLFLISSDEDLQKIATGNPGVGAQACNSSYSGSRDQENNG
jgi:hypothetical protein